MEIQDRYVKTRQYVSLFNIAENVAYALLKMPNGWVIPSNVTKEFNIQCKKDIETQNGYYIFVDLSENQNGITSIFDSIDFIIEFNNAIEERASIFREKAEILKKREEELEENSDLEVKDPCRNLSLNEIKQNI